MLGMPLVFYSTRILWVDDDELFLQAAERGIKDKHNTTVCTSPKDSIAFLEGHSSISSSLSLLRGCRKYEEYDLSDHLPVDIDINSMIKLHENPLRLDDISVMIIDYNMPEMTGLELCQELCGLPVKKILLTGAVDNKLAINAFNEGIIDGFVRKDANTLIDDLLKLITRLKRNYFIDTTKHLLSHLEADYELPQSDPVFINFFSHWCEHNNITDFYLADKNGGLLTINRDGKIQYFVIHSDRSLDNFTNIYNEDEKVSSLIQSIEQRQMIPCFGVNNEAWNFGSNEWGMHFYPCNILEGREKYYWTVIEHDSILKNKSIAA